MLYKDSCNRKSNHQHLGTIKCSNLCTEIVEYSSPTETAVCNLASISLPKFVDAASRRFDFVKLQYVTEVITKNLNKIIDRNYYPVEEVCVQFSFYIGIWDTHLWRLPSPGSEIEHASPTNWYWSPGPQ